MRGVLRLSIVLVLGACAAGPSAPAGPPEGVDETAWRADAAACARLAERRAGADLERSVERPGMGGALRADMARAEAEALRERLYRDCMAARGYSLPD